MGSLLAGFVTAFSLYSVIPMPRVDWDGGSMRYTMCFFPLVGAVTGCLLILWHGLCLRFSAAPELAGAVAVLLPIAVNGGIHMDGFMDTMDALSSHGVREKKLEILKDSHAGAFGVLFCGGYLLLSYGLWQQVYASPSLALFPAVGCMAGRCLSSLSIVFFQPAKRSGMLWQVASSADKRAVALTNGVLLALILVACVWMSPLWGLVAALVTAAIFLLHRRLCLWEFGGNSGDLAGYLLQKTELAFLAIAAVGGLISIWKG